ncbi:hypothetical protein Zmor_008990 [Zophobas morio]|uniref:EF-hand domain-containing protein n=1 Tax=Zophobas morio TaxID=2755281 RepID=A0AA38M1L4_9CUCU|nr:hypothetical protein Zmor_008990 [Zophobas morio]
MGGHLSVDNLSAEETEELCQLTGFSSEQIRNLYTRFKHLDRDNSGTISSEEFISVPELAMNPLITRIIALFDENFTDHINFRDFCFTLSVFRPSGNREAKLRAAFQIYDLDNDGFIGREELYEVVKLMTGSYIDDKQLWKIVDKTIEEADTIDRDGKISLEEFSLVLKNTDLHKRLSVNF